MSRRESLDHLECRADSTRLKMAHAEVARVA